MEDEEKRRAIREEMRGSRGYFRSGCSLIVVALFILASMQMWLWAAVLIVGALFAFFVTGAKVLQIGPANEVQRHGFRTSLLVCGIGRERGERKLPAAVYRSLGPMRWFVSSMSSSTPFTKAANNGPAGIEWLQAKLTSENAFDRWRAVVALELVAPEEVWRSLVPLLQDADPRVKEAAILAIASVGGEEAFPTIRETMIATKDDVQWLAGAGALAIRGASVELDEERIARAAQAIRRDEGEDRKRLAVYLSELPAEATETLLREEFAWNEHLSGKVYANLSLQTSDLAIALLRSALTNPDETLNVIVHIKTIDPRLIPVVESLLDSLSDSHRRYVELRLSHTRAD